MLAQVCKGYNNTFNYIIAIVVYITTEGTCNNIAHVIFSTVIKEKKSFRIKLKTLFFKLRTLVVFKTNR